VARGHIFSLLITYAAEVAGQSGILCRQLFALRLFPDGSVVEQQDFLSLSENSVDAPPDDAPSVERLWRDLFAGWGADRIAAAARVSASFLVAVDATANADAAETAALPIRVIKSAMSVVLIAKPAQARPARARE